MPVTDCTGPYVASVHADAAEALLEDTVDISQVKGDGQNEFHIQRLDSNGRTMASAEKYVKRAAERQAARADHARPKSYLRAFIDYPESYMGMAPERFFEKSTIVKQNFTCYRL